MFPLLILPLQLLHVLAMYVSHAISHLFYRNLFLCREPAFEVVAISQNTSTTSSSKSSFFHPTSAFDAAPSHSNSQAAAATPHLPFSSSLLLSTPIGHHSTPQSTHAPMTQFSSTSGAPFPHHPPNPNPSSSQQPNSSNTPFHPPFHPHPSPSTPTPHSKSSGPSVTQIFFEVLGGVVGLAILLAIVRCIYVYRKTPSSRGSPTPEVGEVERTLALLRPGRILNLGDRIIPPPPYQNAPDYDTIVGSSSGGNESPNTYPSPDASTTANIPSGTTPTINIPNDTPILQTSISASDASASGSNLNAISTPRLPVSIPPNSTGRPPDV